MKNVIEYFYNLHFDEIRKNKTEYFFKSNGENYVFKECNRNLEELQELYKLEKELYYKNIFLHQIILNNRQEFITIVENKEYIMLKIIISENRKININDLFIFNNFKIIGDYFFIARNNWRKLWMDKIDYIEYQMVENKQKLKDFNYSIDYVIGLVEMGIQLLYRLKIDDLYISHNRVNSNTRLRDLYDPLNIILDSRVRDISELIKDNLSDEYLELMEFNNEEACLFFIRTLFLTKYFDAFDSNLLGDRFANKKDLETIINGLEKYENFLKKIYKKLKNKYMLPDVEWLQK